MAARSELCVTLRDVLAVDGDAAAGEIVEAVEQPRNGRLAGAGRADHRHGLAGRHLEADAFEDDAFRLIGEGDVLEADVAAGHLQRTGAGGVLDLRRARNNREHVLDVGHRLLDLAIEHAHEIERLVELDHHGVDQHEIADRLAAGLDLVGAHHHGGGEPDGEEHRLPGVEHGERGVGLDAGVLVARHRAVVAGRLALLGAEIFHGLVVEQRVDRLDIGVGVAVVHLAADADAPFGSVVGPAHIERDRADDEREVAPVEMHHQDDGDQRDLDDGGRELQDHHAHDGLDGVAAALEHARQAAGLALEMEAQRQVVHVDEGAEGKAPDRVHRHLGKHRVAALRERAHKDAHAAVSDRHGDGRRDHPAEPAGGGGGVPRQRVGCVFEGEGNGDGCELGGEQERHGAQHAQLQVAAVGRPDIGPQMHHGRQQRAAAGGDAGRLIGRAMMVTEVRTHGRLHIGGF